MQKYSTARIYKLPGLPRFALGYKGTRALNVTERVRHGQYRGVRGVRPLIPYTADPVSEPSQALREALA